MQNKLLLKVKQKLKLGTAAELGVTDNEEGQVLIREKKLLGVYLSAHPLDAFGRDMESFGKTRIVNLPEKIGAGKIAFVAMFAGYEERLSKKGQRLVYVQLEDQMGSVEGMLFAPDKAVQFPTANSPVVAVGQVDAGFEPGTWRLKIDRVIPLEIARRERVKAISLILSAEDAAADLPGHIEAIKALASRHTGKASLRFVLQFADSEVTIASNSPGVDLNDRFMQNLYALPMKSFDVRYHG